MENTNTNSCSAGCQACACTETEKKSLFSFLKPRVEFRRVRISPVTKQCDVPGLRLSEYEDATVRFDDEGYVDVCWLQPVNNFGYFIYFNVLSVGIWLSIALLFLFFWFFYGFSLEYFYTQWGWI